MHKDVFLHQVWPPLARARMHRPSVGPLARSTYALVLAGERGSRLKQLTTWRAKPALSFGGNHRIIDFPLSNCINSGVSRIGVLTQYKAHSLIQHVRRAWHRLDSGPHEFIDLLPAQPPDLDSGSEVTTGAVYQNLDTINLSSPAFVLVLAGDHVYKMDYSVMLAEHAAARADVTVACIDGPSTASVEVDAEQRVIGFHRNADDAHSLPERPQRLLASMGVYVFNATFLYRHLREAAHRDGWAHDFCNDLLPSLIGRADVRAHLFDDSCVNRANGRPYWRDVSTLDAYWEANIDLTTARPQLDLSDPHWPIRSFEEPVAPSQFARGDERTRSQALDSLISPGSIVIDAAVRRSLLSTGVVVERHSVIEDSVVLPNVEIGRSVTLKHAIVDKFCRLPDDFTAGLNLEQDRKRFEVTDQGTILITPEMLGQHLHSVD